MAGKSQQEPVHSNQPKVNALNDELYKALKGENSECTATLSECLQRWKDKEYLSLPDYPPIAAYVLEQTYTLSELKQGVEGLKGSDSQTLRQALPVANGLGFVVALGNFTKTVEGKAEERCDYAYFKCRRYHSCWDDSGDDDFDDEDEDPPEMGEVEEESCKISHVIRVDGLSEMQLKELAVEEDCLVPRDALMDNAPDGQRYEKYGLSNSSSISADLEQWYNHSVLILFQVEDETALRIAANGVNWTLEQLNSDTESPSESAELIVSALLKNLEWGDQHVEKLGPAIEAFNLKDIKPGLAQLVKESASLSTCFAIIDTIAAKAGKGTKTWLDTLRKDAVTSYKAADIDDVPTLVEVAQSKGATVLETSILTNISKTESYNFLVALAKALQEFRTKHRSSTKKDRDTLAKLVKAIQQCVMPIDRMKELVDLFFAIDRPDLCITLRENISADKDLGYSTRLEFAKTLQVQLAQLSDTETTADDTRKTLKNAIRATLQDAVPKWEGYIFIVSMMQPSMQQYFSHHYVEGETSPSNPTAPNRKMNRVCEFVDLCLMVGDLAPCVTLFDRILGDSAAKDDRSIDETFGVVFVPLIPQLKATLSKHNVPITSHSRPKTPKTIIPVLPTRTAGCRACTECKQLSAFINNPKASIPFCASLATRKHVESEIVRAKISDIVTTETVKDGSPHTLLVTKRAEPLAQLRWREAKGKAEAFLRSVAAGEELKHLMAERYNDTAWAIQGRKVFPAVGL
ncbi:hypothetical protein FA13DRAFT_1791245 [Coprinellus micaceus]|uniref:Uncharacterized protein n=1 Tax=Coprinellus micaceus TaxID=71717 RepID=A0A4Y7TEG0_COPMI|nr:hypothetical protein FA13DRAFT_1791245 [Coprinellus micaceus]